MKTKKAIYKGSNGSLGYFHNKEYDLKISITERGILINRVLEFDYQDGFCIYSNVKTFLANWDITQNIFKREILFEKKKSFLRQYQEKILANIYR